MTLEIGFLFALLGGMIYLFLTEKLPVDLTAFLGLVVLILTGYLEPGEAFLGFASPAVITMLAIFIVGAGLLHTGVADRVGGRIHSIFGSREAPLTIMIMLVAGILSAFMNNIAAAAVLMPAVASLAKRANLAPSRLFMPLAYGAIFGGMTTLVGTPPNILASAMLRERGLKPFSLFDFTPIGLALFVVGVLFMATFGRKLLPTRGSSAAATSLSDLAEVYQLRDRVFSIKIPPDSGMGGRTLGELRLTSTLGVQVVGILRGGRRQLAPEASTVVLQEDVLLVEGRLGDLKQLLKVQGIEIFPGAPRSIPRPIPGVTALQARLAPQSTFVGRTLKDLRFRERFGAVVVGIRRDDFILKEELALQKLREGDELIALGTRSQLEDLATLPEFSKTRIGLSAVQPIQANLHLVRVTDRSPLVGTTIAQSRIGQLVGLTIAGIIREGETLLAASPDEAIQEGDTLIIGGEASRLVALLEIGHIEIEPQEVEPVLESDDVGIVEAAIAPRSNVAGKSLDELSFRERYGLQALAIWREGSPIYEGIARIALRFGDALLLQGPKRRVHQLAADPDFLVLSESAQVPHRRRKEPFAVGALLLMVGMVVSGFQPIHVAAFTAATLVVLSGALRMEEAYRAIEWRALFLVAAVLPVGMALERTGAALLLAQTVTSLAGDLGPYAVLGTLVILSSMLSQGLDGAPTVVLLTPVVVETAGQLGMSPYPLMMGVALAASAAFMTPFSHKVNLLVMGAGGYRTFDYVKVGTPLTIAVVLLLVFLIPFFFPF